MSHGASPDLMAYGIRDMLLEFNATPSEAFWRGIAAKAAT